METSYKPARKSIDLGLLIPLLLLVGMGVVMVYSASSAVAFKRYGSDYFFLKKQVLFAVVGLTALIITSQIPYKIWKIFVYPGLIVSIGLLVLVYIIGHEAGNATRWLKIGPFSFQPVEMARLALILYLAYSLSKKDEKIRNFAVGTFPHVVVTIVLCGLVVMQPDFGSTVIMLAIMAAMLFIAGVPIYHLLLVGLPAIVAGILIMVKESYRVKRLMSFLDPWQYESDLGYQVVHSLMAFGTGGITGAGIGAGMQKLFYLPEAHTDFIFAVLGEELGLAGTLPIIIIYFWVVVKGLNIARKAPDTFSALLAAGISFSIGLQICLNLGVVMGLLPTKGLALPFLSYGGTSLLFTMAACGILLNISTYVSEIEAQKTPRTKTTKTVRKRNDFQTGEI